jgi:hypothetical protein
MFIMASVLVVSIGGSSVLLTAIKMGGVQSESTKAYFAAEAGAERLLFEVRKNQSVNLLTPYRENIFSTTQMPEGASYVVNYDGKVPKLTFTSIGSYERTKRSVEVSF